MSENGSLYDKYGGFSGVSKIVHAFYAKINESETLAPWFESVEMHRLIDHQTQFFSSILGGPVEYTGKQLESVHKRLAITNDAFVEVAGLLEEALEDCEVTEEDIETILGIVAATKNKIVSQ